MDVIRNLCVVVGVGGVRAWLGDNVVGVGVRTGATRLFCRVEVRVAGIEPHQNPPSPKRCPRSVPQEGCGVRADNSYEDRPDRERLSCAGSYVDVYHCSTEACRDVVSGKIDDSSGP